MARWIDLFTRCSGPVTILYIGESLLNRNGLAGLVITSQKVKRAGKRMRRGFGLRPRQHEPPVPGHAAHRRLAQLADWVRLGPGSPGPVSKSPAACASWWRRSVCLIWPPGYRGGMAETQREPVPRVDSGELDTALAFLSFARHCVLKKANGLSEEQLRREIGRASCRERV